MLRYVRLPLMGATALDAARRELAGAPEPFQAMVHEAYLVSLIAPERGARPSDLRLLDASTLRPRSGRLEAAEATEEEEDGESAAAAAGAVRALAAVAGAVASGTSNGALRLWSAEERAPLADLAEGGGGDSPPILCATAWEGRLATGHEGGQIRLWEPAGGALALEHPAAHRDGVHALAARGPRLASGSYDTTVRVWVRGPPGELVCERVLDWHTGLVAALATHAGRLYSASMDRTIRAWEVATGERLGTLYGHAGGVCALAVAAAAWDAHGGGAVLASSGTDQTVRGRRRRRRLWLWTRTGAERGAPRGLRPLIATAPLRLAPPPPLRARGQGPRACPAAPSAAARCYPGTGDAERRCLGGD